MNRLADAALSDAKSDSTLADLLKQGIGQLAEALVSPGSILLASIRQHAKFEDRVSSGGTFYPNIVNQRIADASL